MNYNWLQKFKEEVAEAEEINKDIEEGGKGDRSCRRF